MLSGGKPMQGIESLHRSLLTPELVLIVPSPLVLSMSNPVFAFACFCNALTLLRANISRWQQVICLPYLSFPLIFCDSAFMLWRVWNWHNSTLCNRVPPAFGMALLWPGLSEGSLEDLSFTCSWIPSSHKQQLILQVWDRSAYLP